MALVEIWRSPVLEGRKVGNRNLKKWSPNGTQRRVNGYIARPGGTGFGTVDGLCGSLKIVTTICLSNQSAAWVLI